MTELSRRRSESLISQLWEVMNSAAYLPVVLGLS